jgi:catechol 2,3-dioxygenase-like lactoylglutathione lyase family enzyme
MISVDHIGIPARDKQQAAQFLAGILDARSGGPGDVFAPVLVAPGFTIDFYDAVGFQPLHLAFAADDEDFDAILARLRSRAVAYGSSPHDPANSRTDHPLAARGLYFRTPDGHLLEVMARPLAGDCR